MSLKSLETILLNCIMTDVIVCVKKKSILKLVHFCVAILILNMEENIFGILCFIISRKVKMHLKHKKICTMYGEGGVTDQKCQK